MLDNIFKGIHDGEKAFCGPHTAQIDLTDKCNNSCIACWVHSPLIDRNKAFPCGEKELPFDLVKNLIKELHRLGVQEVILSGSGEPFLYPRIKEVIRAIKSKGIYLNIITNALLVNDEIARFLVSYKVDLITASIWAGTAESYSATHPKKTARDFEQIKENLKRLAFYKNKSSSLKPHLKIFNVICSNNFDDIEAMVEFSRTVDADSTEFQVVDIIPGKTDSLAISSSQQEKIIEQLTNIRGRNDLAFFNTPKDATLADFAEERSKFLDFGKVWKNYKNGFSFGENVNYLICKKGEIFPSQPMVVSGSPFTKDTHPAVFWYKFKSSTCATCAEKNKCLDDQGAIDIKFLNILGVGAFLRRLLYSDLQKGIYEKQINNVPCYIGWYYVRIFTDGSVSPCCKAVEFPMGNIFKDHFTSIWNSGKYEEFRFNAKNLSKSNAYFSKIDCLKSCDNWGMNLEIDAKLKEPSWKHVSYFKKIKQHISEKGLSETLKKSFLRLTPNNLRNDYLKILGVYDGEYGYNGPFHVQIDLTNDCNNNCIACWCNSPLLKQKRLSENEKKQYLPLGMVKELLDEISLMGTTEIYYSGSGEPFMHPQIMEVLEYTKGKGITCHVNTNFTLLDKDKLDKLMKIGVDFLTVSTWAATEEIYAKTHPNRNKEDFYRIKENLIYLNKQKKFRPHIKLYNVLFNMNYFEVEKMVDFAAETKSESLEFTLIDTMPNATDILSLNEKQLKDLRESCQRIKSRLDRGNRVKDSGVLIFQFDQFLRRISSIEDAQRAMYDRNIIDRMPCYIGWLFTRIIPNGEFHSCLKAHRIPTGSLYLNRFSEIWNSEKQCYFRKKTLVNEKKDRFFRLIGNDPDIQNAGCYKSCDDIGRNNWMHERLGMLTQPEKVALRTVAKSLKLARQIKPQNNGYKNYHGDPLVAGVLHGRKAFIGPEQVVVDITNRCNLRCITCWLYSPYLKEDRPSGEWLKNELSKDALFKLIDDLSDLGTKRIRLTGGGEPFMHRDLIDIVEHARGKHIPVSLTSNLILATPDGINKLIESGMDELCVSIWASNAETYSIVHPGAPASCFEKLKENLISLNKINRGRARVTFANVIVNNNFRDFQGMYEFGLNYGADAIYYTIADVFQGQTDKFLLDQEERAGLLRQAIELKERSKNYILQLEYFEGFLRRLSMPQGDFQKGEFDKSDINKIPCYVGWIFSRILADGGVAPCCRGVKKIMGNINEKSFKDIWFSDQYNDFRSRAKYSSKEVSYFREIGCIKECDNLMHNEEMNNRIKSNFS